MYNDKLKESIKEILENDTRIGEYEDNSFIIFDGWEDIRKINALMGYNDEYDHRTGSDKLDLDQILPWLYSNIPFPIDQNDINRFYKDLEINQLIESGQLSYIDNIKPDLSIFEKVKDIILQYKDDLDLDYLNEDIKDLIDKTEWGFSDEYEICSECNTVLRTSPDSYGWVPNYYQDPDGYKYCQECCESGGLIEYSIENTQYNIDNGQEPNSLPWIFDLTDEWHMIQPDLRYDFSKWENGLHGGQVDSPLKQGQIVRSEKYEGESLFEIVYRIHPSQFYVEWDVYIRVNPNIENLIVKLDDYIDYFRDIFNSPDGQVNHDPKVLMEKALKQVKPAYSTIETNSETGEINITGTNDINEYFDSHK